MYRCPDAVACIRGREGAPHLCDEVLFYQECGHVLVVADVFYLEQIKLSRSAAGAFRVLENAKCAGSINCRHAQFT